MVEECVLVKWLILHLYMKYVLEKNSSIFIACSRYDNMNDVIKLLNIFY